VYPIEKCLKISNGKIIGVLTRLFGLDCSVFEPVLEDSLYQNEDEEYCYSPVPAFEGKLLIVGINQIRMGAVDDWTPQEIKLFCSMDVKDTYIPSENAKIVVRDHDNIFNLRVLYRRTITGQHLELIYIFELIPFQSYETASEQDPEKESAPPHVAKRIEHNDEFFD
jgi:hypothetical protein